MNRSNFVEKTKALLMRRRETLEVEISDELMHLGTDEDFESLDDEVYFGMAERESNELERIEDTLERIRTGRYGVCEECGHNISLARLQALSCATHCITCQRATEAHGPRKLFQFV